MPSDDQDLEKVVSEQMSDQTWIYDVKAAEWVEIQPATGPPALSACGMAYDSTSDKVILFGGETLEGLSDETWCYSPSERVWTKMNPESRPSARTHHAMAFDPDTKRVMLFGGYCGMRADYSSDDFNDETWLYDYETDTWERREPSERPPGRNRHAITYDLTSKRVVLFGGYLESGLHGRAVDDTWTYDVTADSWTRMAPNKSPPPRGGHALVYHARMNRVVLFGGSEYQTQERDDTWAYSYKEDSWTRLSPSVSPPPCQDHMMAYDPKADRIVVVGGRGETSLARGVWEYDSQQETWRETRAAGGPSAPYDAGLCSAGGQGQIILFGGWAQVTETLTAEQTLRWREIQAEAATRKRRELMASVSLAILAIGAVGLILAGWISPWWLLGAPAIPWGPIQMGEVGFDVLYRSIDGALSGRPDPSITEEAFFYGLLVLLGFIAYVYLTLIALISAPFVARGSEFPLWFPSYEPLRAYILGGAGALILSWFFVPQVFVFGRPVLTVSPAAGLSFVLGGLVLAVVSYYWHEHRT